MRLFREERSIRKTLVPFTLRYGRRSSCAIGQLTEQRREAYEEVNLSMDDPNVHLITTLPPVLTVLPLNAHMRNHIIVTRECDWHLQYPDRAHGYSRCVLDNGSYGHRPLASKSRRGGPHILASSVGYIGRPQQQRGWTSRKGYGMVAS